MHLLSLYSSRTGVQRPSSPQGLRLHIGCTQPCGTASSLRGLGAAFPAYAPSSAIKTTSKLLRVEKVRGEEGNPIISHCCQCIRLLDRKTATVHWVSERRAKTGTKGQKTKAARRGAGAGGGGRGEGARGRRRAGRAS